MSEEKKRGFLGKAYKIIMVIIFMLIGAGLITLGAVYIAKGYDKGTIDTETYNIRWISILNIVFGSLLMTSPYFLKSNKEVSHGVIEKVIKIIMVVLFVVIGLTLLAGGIYAIATKYDAPKWLSICNIQLYKLVPA